MKKIIFLFVLGVIIFVKESKCQTQSSSGYLVKMDGFIVNLGGKFLFQPSEDSTMPFLKSLDNRAFTIWQRDFNDLYFKAIEYIGDSLIVNGYDSLAKKNYIEILYFFPCSLEVYLFFGSEKSITIYSSLRENFSYNSIQYRFSDIGIENTVSKIIPSKKSDLLKMYNYYYINGYNVPTWLKNLVDSTKHTSDLF